MKCSSVILVIVALLISLSEALYFPFGRGGYGGYRGGGGGGRQRNGRTYTDIASIINGNPYGSPRSRPFPQQPFWPFG